MDGLANDAPLTKRAIYDTYRSRYDNAAPGGADDWRRDHLGASIIGHKCDRFLWLTFRWAAKPDLTGRELRLFDTGKREEGRVIDDLRAAGVAVHDRDEDGEQFRITFANGHGGGSLDFVAESLPDSDNVHVGEVKTHGKKSFEYLQAKGLHVAKPEHYVQLQLYMREQGIERGVYIGVCKDTDDIYVERIRLDAALADAAMARGEEIINAPEPPPRLDSRQPPCVYTSKDGTTWPCRFWALCHEKQMPERNCRTCISSTPEPDGTWSCRHLDIANLLGISQRAGCSDHCPIPSIVNATVASVEDRKITFQFADGEVRES